VHGTARHAAAFARVAERAEAIHDALYGDHRELATAPTTQNDRPG
jgi:hypothetical protein